MIDRAAIAAARRQLATQPDFLRTTPLMRLSGKSLGVDCAEVWLKLEHLQVGGSFKARGMLYRLLANPVPESGVIIASGGNAGIAVAAAAQALGVRCEVFVPEVSPEAKRARLRALGAEVVVTGAAYSEAFEACVARQKTTGALQAHAYDQPEVVAGAGTLALEMEEQGGRLPDGAGQRGRRWPHWRCGRMGGKPRPCGGAGARTRAHPARRAGCGPAGGCGGGWRGRRLARCPPHRGDQLGSEPAPRTRCVAAAR